MLRLKLLVALVLSAGTISFSHAQGIPNPDQKPLHLDTEMDDIEALPENFQRQPVFYRTHEPTGTIIVDTTERYLYLIKGNNVAIRYGIGVGRDGFAWNGLQKVSRKAEWPDWTPPAEMIERQPYLPRWMAGGPGNPMGARALYLGATIYRIHGTNQPETIGHAVSSGCFRLVNEDVTHLYDQVAVGARVIIMK